MKPRDNENENSKKLSKKVKEALPTQVREVEKVSEDKIQKTLLIVRPVALSSLVLIKKCLRCTFREILDQSV